MKLLAKLVLLLIITSLPVRAVSAVSAGEAPDRAGVAGTLTGLRGSLPALELSRPPAAGDAAQAYFDHYHLNVAGAVHHFGAIPATGYSIAVHTYRPEDPVGTVYVIHGYLDHSGLYGQLARRLCGDGYAVVLFDLPGHGLSSGEPAAIEDFGRYGEVFQEVYRRTGAAMPGPHFLVAHSTGASVALDLIQSGKARPFGRIVLLAPLVRSAHWDLSRAGAALAGPFVDAVPRKFRVNSADEKYIAFVRDDPLQSRRVPMSWIRALENWNARAEAWSPRPGKVLVIQGTADVIVDWRYNMEFLKRKFPDARIELVEGANHQLVNEAHRYRERVFSLLEGYLKAESRIPGLEPEDPAR